ncbi:hypothetical protein FRC07_001963 [Ceratobasidium sp. 392]|nr:hypothetical protein FRC07_001963 [Ceratobasidium sp. 392]
MATLQVASPDDLSCDHKLFGTRRAEERAGRSAGSGVQVLPSVTISESGETAIYALPGVDGAAEARGGAGRRFGGGAGGKAREGMGMRLGAGKKMI